MAIETAPSFHNEEANGRAGSASCNDSIDTATGKAAPAEISSKRVKAIFSDIAPNYDRFNRMSSFGRYKAWLHTLIDEAPINSRTVCSTSPAARAM